MKALWGILLALAAGTSWAALGGAPAALGPRDAAVIAHAASAGFASYTDRQRLLDSGTRVREYVGADGTVFAVSWAGPFLPDLKELLGGHFDTLVSQAGQTGGRRSSQVAVRRPDVVILSAGHMGAFEGRAWLPARLPQGFDPAEIR